MDNDLWVVRDEMKREAEEEGLRSCAWPSCNEPDGGRLSEDYVHDGVVVCPARTLLRDPYCCGDHMRRHLYDHEEAPPRITWPESWMTVARTMAQRSYDPRLKVGCVIVPEDNTSVLGIGYNGNYRGGPHQHESTEPGQSGFIHAEVNALVKCDFNFPKRKYLYVTHSPCRTCAKLIINADIARVVYETPYRDTSGVDLLRSVGIETLSLEDAILTARGR